MIIFYIIGALFILQLALELIDYIRYGRELKEKANKLECQINILEHLTNSTLQVSVKNIDDITHTLKTNQKKHIDFVEKNSLNNRMKHLSSPKKNPGIDLIH